MYKIYYADRLAWFAALPVLTYSKRTLRSGSRKPSHPIQPSDFLRKTQIQDR